MTYRRTYEELLRAEDYQSASLVGKRLTHALPNDLNLQYQQAVVSEKLGGKEQAQEPPGRQSHHEARGKVHKRTVIVFFFHTYLTIVPPPRS